jgi:RNA recognition motif-containing protein
MLLYVGGLDNGAITLEMLSLAFHPFGEIKQLYWGSEDRNFAFLEFSVPQDAHPAIENMHLAEIADRVIRCNWARGNEA